MQTDQHRDENSKHHGPIHHGPIRGEQKNWLMCHACGELHHFAPQEHHETLVCSHCDNVLHSGQSVWLTWGAALICTALFLFFLSHFLPFMTLEIGSQSLTMNIMDGFFALLAREQWILAGLFLTTVFLFPLFEILAFLFLLVPYHLNRRVRGQRHVLRWLIIAESWSMQEVFLLSVVVGAVKMADMAYLNLNSGSVAFFMMVAVLLFVFNRIDRRKLWSWINTHNYFVSDTDHQHNDGSSRKGHEAVYDCTICHAMVGESLIDHLGHCPRCKNEIHRRIPHSLQKTFALTLAAAILYIPANVLPIMTYSTLGEVETDTIMSGVIALVGAGLYWIALVVFVASVAVPLLKIMALTYLVFSVKLGMQSGARLRAKVYRITEFVGRWSMVDVFVVTIFVAIVQFGFVYTVEPEGAIVAFGAVVILTMIAAESFDPRLIWDALEDDGVVGQALPSSEQKVSPDDD